MEAKDIFAGPIVRRAQPDMIAIWVATRNWFLDLVAVVRPVGDKEWLGVSQEHWELAVFPNLYIHLFIVEPFEPYEVFPANTLLEYSIVELTFKPGESENVWDSLLSGKLEVDFSSFEKIVREDKLSYPGLKLPTLYLQDRDRKLCAFYASCRKIHGKEGGDYDALARGDDMIAESADTPWDFEKRPAVLALVGDQIYADDVHDDVFHAVSSVAKELAGDLSEDLDKVWRGKGHRMSFVRGKAGFTSEEAENHLLTLAEYAAMYGLAWCPHNWSAPYPEAAQKFVNDLPKVRRLMANTPTYMAFDDHDVTDDWNLSVSWKRDVWARPAGRRIVANALYAFWLFQACGNDPGAHRQSLKEIEGLNDDLPGRSGKLGGLVYRIEKFFWGYDQWEFSTPTRPFIYFLDTRTERGHRDGSTARDSGPPAFLKSIASWKKTMARMTELLRDQSRDYPLVMVVPAPVLTFRVIFDLQKAEALARGPYHHDLEHWPNNHISLLLFFRLCRDYDVVLLSGDVHYGYTSTMEVSHFDDDSYRAVVKEFPELRFPKTGSGATPTYQFLFASKYLQLTSSAAKNYASTFLQSIAVGLRDEYVLNNHGALREGRYRDGELRLLIPDTFGQPEGPVVTQPQVVKLEDYKPSCAIQQFSGDPYNSPYLDKHNIGFVVIDKKKVGHWFLAQGGSGPVSPRTWDFANRVYWEGARP